MRNYESPEAVEIGRASTAILGGKFAILGDDILGPDYEMMESSILDSD